MPLPFKLKFLLWLDGLNSPDISKLTPITSRANMRKSLNQLKWLIHEKDEVLFSIEERPLALREGLIKVRIYRPVEKKGLPLILFFHGGGFVQGDVYTHDHNCRRIAIQNNAVVVSVDYRLAPEFPFPVPGQDCYEATLWAVEHATSLGADPNKLIVMGDSAGGNLATVVAMMARDLGGPAIKAQVLIYPSLDATLSMSSVQHYGKGYFLTKEKMNWYVAHYTGTADKKHPYLSPLLAPDLKCLPPALIITAEFDPLIDEGELYAKRLRNEGVSVVYKEYKGMIHGFFSMPGLLKEAREAESEITTFCRSL
jgi:acetyl esterase